MRINQNIAAFNAFRNLSVTNSMLGKSLEKPSSGIRINRAADDAAGLAKSESLRAEIRGNRAAVRNARDGISFVQTAEGALNEVHAILQRMRELAVDAANTATTDGTAQHAEYTELLGEPTAIGTRTKFAGNTVFSNTSMTFQVGANNGDTLAITDDLRITTDGSNGIFTGTNLSTVNLDTGAAAAIAVIDGGIDDVSDIRATLGAKQNRLEHVITNPSVAAEMVEFTRNQIMVQAGTAMLAQANQVPASLPPSTPSTGSASSN